MTKKEKTTCAGSLVVVFLLGWFLKKCPPEGENGGLVLRRDNERTLPR